MSMYDLQHIHIIHDDAADTKVTHPLRLCRHCACRRVLCAQLLFAASFSDLL
jgi:hypothetical protein